MWRLVLSVRINTLTYLVASLRIYSFLMKMSSEEMSRGTIASLLYVVYTYDTELNSTDNL